MGNSQSSSTSKKDMAVASLEASSTSASERGLKSEENNVVGMDVLSSDDSSLLDSEESDEEDELSEEELEEMMERERILSDARKLKQLAHFYMHPESPVEVDGTAFARCFFSQPFATEQESLEEAEEAASVLRDRMLMKQYVTDYYHPEIKVVTSDPTAFARNYFSRPSAEEQETFEEAEERARILEDAKNLKKLAVDYLHPELPVVTTDGAACGRNYFSRPSAPEYDAKEEREEREMILSDVLKLKKLAVDYMHPELPVQVDATAFARNYFSRYSAPEQTSQEEEEELAQILADSMQLKQLAVDYMHPELPVQVDATAFGRNYFSRYSAPEQTTKKEEEERTQILADAMQLKKLAVDYLHPEIKVVTSDPTACGRNYFSRPSAAVDDKLITAKADQKKDKKDGAKQTYKQDTYGFFDMDEDLFAEVRENLVLPVRISGKNPKDQDEGDLSRSPSSVMLFGLGGEDVY